MTAPLAALAFTTRVAKRAQYEAFAFTVAADGVVVRNESHADPSAHEYRVTVDEGLPTACECPADQQYEGACKHRVAVAIRTPVLAAASRRGDVDEVARASESQRSEGGAQPTTSVEVQ